MIGKLIKKYRVKYGLTTREMAKLLDVSHGLITLYEKGKRNPGVKKRRKIIDLCKTLKLHPDTLEPIEKSAWDEIYNTYLKKAPLISKRLSVFFSKYRSELENMPAKE
jgi:transcriptional regulator with XRE-family HTH domain